MFRIKSLLHRHHKDNPEALASQAFDLGIGTSPQKNFALAGTTLRVYKLLVTKGAPVGPREVQRALNLSSPTVASFHLEKLVRNGLIAKKEYEGTYVVHKIYLKHFILLRRRLIPRYFLYGTLSTAIIAGWIAIMFFAGLLDPAVVSFSRVSILYVFLYGMMASVALCFILWRETLRVLKNEEI
ncbi:MAG TPA: helix-turn-helix domain-containing protein [Nitrososphaerales archaeon]|nr:helix-turn-helix domain-containing protein [Nitrososphaerales archaeon]